MTVPISRRRSHGHAVNLDIVSTTAGAINTFSVVPELGTRMVSTPGRFLTGGIGVSATVNLTVSGASRLQSL